METEKIIEKSIPWWFLIALLGGTAGFFLGATILFSIIIYQYKTKKKIKISKPGLILLLLVWIYLTITTLIAGFEPQCYITTPTNKTRIDCELLINLSNAFAVDYALPADPLEKSWQANYSDQPQQSRIFQAALTRNKKNASRQD